MLRVCHLAAVGSYKIGLQFFESGCVLFGIYLLKYALVEQVLGSLDEFSFQAGISGKFWYDVDYIGLI